MMQPLTPKDAALLDALATYRILSIKQCVRLGLGERGHIGDRLRFLAGKGVGLVKILERARMTGPNLHWLTARGAKVVEELAEDAGEPRKVGVRRIEYRLGPHLRQRELTVDCHIALRQWAARNGARVDWVRAEYDPTETKLTKATALEWQGVAYEADALASLTPADGESWLLALEVETGGEAESLENFSKRLSARLDAIERHVPELALGWPDNRRQARLLFVFKSAAMLERAKRLTVRPEAAVWRRIHLKAVQDVVEDFGSPWWQVGGEAPFPPATA